MDCVMFSPENVSQLYNMSLVKGLLITVACNNIPIRGRHNPLHYRTDSSAKILSSIYYHNGALGSYKEIHTYTKQHQKIL